MIVLKKMLLLRFQELDEKKVDLFSRIEEKKISLRKLKELKVTNDRLLCEIKRYLWLIVL